MLAVLATLAGCATAPQKTSQSAAAVSVAQNPNNFMSLYELFLEQYQQFQKEENFANLQAAMLTGRKLLAQQPDLYQAKELLYRLMVSEYLAFSTDSNYDRLKQFYEANPQLSYVDLAPPHFIKALSGYLFKSLNKTQILALLKMAIAENPLFAASYNLTASLHEEAERYGLALYNAKKAFKLNPVNTEYGESLATAYSNVLYDQSCLTSDNPMLPEALEHTKVMIKNQPDNLVNQLDLAYYYQVKGQKRLFNFAAKKLADKDAEYLWLYRESMLWNGQFDKIQASISEDAGEASEVFTMTFYSHLMHQDWDAVLAMEADIFQIEEPSVFEIAYMSMVMRQQSGDDVADAFLLKNQDRYEVNYWNRTFFEYASGEINGEQLLGKTASRCELAEAHFAVSFEALLKNDDPAAKSGLQQVADQKVGSYLETVVASYWLKNM